MALFGFLQEPLHLSLPKYRSRQQMPVKLRRNNARRRARFVASSDSLLLTCDVNVFLQAARNVGHHLLNDLKRPHAMMESVLNMPERKDQGSLATSRTTSLIIRPSASATGSQKEATSPRSNGPRRFGPEVSIRRHALARAPDPGMPGSPAGLPLYRHKHSEGRKVRKILQRRFPQGFWGQTAFRIPFFYRGAL